MDVYQTLKSKTGIEIEHPLVEELHESLVIRGDFDKAEKTILEANRKSIFQSFVNGALYTPDWQKLNAYNDGKEKL